MKLWEKAKKILNGGDVLLITSEDIFSLQALTSIPQIVSELETNNFLSEETFLSKNCVENAHAGCALIFQEIQKRLDALIDKGCENFTELEKAVEAHDLSAVAESPL